VKSIPGVVKTDFVKMAVGDIVPPIENKGSRYGLIVISGKDRNELDTVLDKVIKVLKIEVETKNGIKGIIWN
jgi:hypothetical protein